MQRRNMKKIKLLILLATAILLVACASPQEKAAKAQERAADSQYKLTQERLRLTEEHEECVSAAGADQAKMMKCDQILKRMEALR